MILFLHGSDRFGIEERLQQLRREHDPTGLNTTVIERAGDQLSELRSACLAPGFFGTQRLVIAHDLLTPAKGGRGRRSTAASRAELVSLLQRVPPTTVLIVVETALTVTEERALKKDLDDLQVERHDVPRGRDLITWAQRRAKEFDATLEGDAAGRLLEALFPAGWRQVARRDDVPPDLHRLAGEIAKLATAAGAGGVITSKLVATLVPEADAPNIWGLTDAIINGDAAAAVREIELALATGAVAEMLIGQLAAQLEVYAVVACARGQSPAAVAAETGLSEARLQRAGRSARRFPLERIERGLGVLRAIDVAAKQGEGDATEMLVGAVAQLAAGS